MTRLILGGDAFDADRMLEDETLSLSLTGTNGHLPRKALQSTLLDRPVHASQNVLRVRNLCAPTQPCYPRRVTASTGGCSVTLVLTFIDDG